MKKIVVVALFVMSALLSASSSLQAQVRVHVQLSGNWQNLSTCPPVFTSGGTVSLVESQPDDFFGDNGANNNSYYTLNIALPPGLAFDPTGATIWSNATSANLQNGSGVVAYSWTDVDDSVLTNYGIDLAPQSWPSTYPGEVNTISIRGIMVKNTHKLDSIYLTPIRIKVLPGSGSVTPSGNFFAWTSDESGARRTGFALNHPDAFVRGLPQIGTVSGLGSSVITTTPGNAAALKWAIEPAPSIQTDHEVQGRITGADPASWPTIQAVDCNGYNTSTGLTNADVTLSLLDPAGLPASSPSTLWNGNGPSYVGSVATVSPAAATLWSSGQMVLTFSVNGVLGSGLYKIRATANGIASPLTSTNIFSVKQRLPIWQTVPSLTSQLAGPGVNDIFIGNSPSFTTPDLINNPVSGAKARMEIHEESSVPSYDYATALAPIPLVATEAFGAVTISPAVGNPTFSIAQSIFSLTDARRAQDPLYAAVAMVYTTDVASTINGGVTSYTSGPTQYVDPRYAITQAPITNYALPVELISFTALLRNNAVSLKWSTATETNNYGFEVERSEDGAMWTKIGFVSGNGTTSSQRDYAFANPLTEADLLRPTLSYRLRQIDRDGTFEYSPVVTVALAPSASSVKLMQNFPNPFNPSTNITFNMPESGAATLTVYNELGMEVARLLDNASVDAGWHTASFNASALPSGVYMYRLQTAAGATTKTMIVSK